MTSPLTPAQAAAAVKDLIGDFGFAWMTDRAGRERGKSEFGLRGRPLYHLGRCGVLGDVPVEVVIAVEAFFPPDVVRAAWEEGRAVVEPRAAALFYAGVCADHARGRFADSPENARLVDLLERVVDGAPYLALPLFVGWRALPRPDDVPGRLGLLLNCLREHRGSVHAAAVAALGLGPLEAIVAGSRGEANARFFEWPEPYPDPDPHRARWDAAEDLTAAAAGLPYDALTSDERGELVALVQAALAG
jgi:hypothetical protein